MLINYCNFMISSAFKWNFVQGAGRGRVNLHVMSTRLYTGVLLTVMRDVKINVFGYLICMFLQGAH